MAGAYTDIDRILREARRRQLGIVLGVAVGSGLAGALLCLLAGAVALAAGARTPFRVVALAGAALALAAAAALIEMDA